MDASDNVKSHVGSAGERWAVLKKAGRDRDRDLPESSTDPAPCRGALREPKAPRAAGRRRQADAARDAAARQRRSPPSSSPIATAGSARTGRVADDDSGRRGEVPAGSGHTIEELDRLVADKKPLPRFPLTGTLHAQAALKRTPIDSENVIGIVEGSDPRLKNEYVVMSAHLDHLGIGRPVNGDSIYNGAMDDASGVASVIEIARLLKASAIKTKRSVLFMAQTAEEKGELGSKYLAGHPTVPFDTLVADINLDMFLPLYPLKVIEVQGLAESSLGDTVRAAAKVQGVDVQTDREPEQNRFIRSDQYSFIKRGIPSLAFKFGYEFGSPEEKIRRAWVRDVYHKPNDDVKQPVDTEAAATFDRVIMGLLERVANDSARPTWNDTSFFKRFATAR
jgi:hypothetical protein